MTFLEVTLMGLSAPTLEKTGCVSPYLCIIQAIKKNYYIDFTQLAMEENTTCISYHTYLWSVQIIV